MNRTRAELLSMNYELFTNSYICSCPPLINTYIYMHLNSDIFSTTIYYQTKIPIKCLKRTLLQFQIMLGIVRPKDNHIV